MAKIGLPGPVVQCKSIIINTLPAMFCTLHFKILFNCGHSKDRLGGRLESASSFGATSPSLISGEAFGILHL